MPIVCPLLCCYAVTETHSELSCDEFVSNNEDSNNIIGISVQFTSVQYEYFYSTIKQDVALRPGSNIKPNTSS